MRPCKRLAVRSTFGAPYTLHGTDLSFAGSVFPIPSIRSSILLKPRLYRVRFALTPLLARRFAITECTLFEPKFIIRQLENGDWLMPLPAPRPRVAETAKDRSVATGRGASFRAELQRFQLRSGNAVFLNAKNRAIVTLERVNISGQIASDHTVAGIFEVGRTDLFNSLKPRKVGGSFTWDGRVLDLPDIQGSLAGGKLAGKYRVETQRAARVLSRHAAHRRSLAQAR